MHSKRQAQREVYGASRLTARGQQIYGKQSRLQTVVGKLPKLANKPKTSASNSSNSSISAEKSAPQKARGGKAASIEVTSRKPSQASADNARAKSELQTSPKMIEQQVDSVIAAVRALAKGEKTPDQALNFEYSTPLSEELRLAVNYVLLPSNATASTLDAMGEKAYSSYFTKGKADSFLFRFAQYLGDLVERLPSDPALGNALHKAIARINEVLTQEFDEPVPGLASSEQVSSSSSDAATEFVREHIAALKQAINQITTGGENPFDLAQFEPATEVSAAVVSAVKHAAKFGQTWGFTHSQGETFVGQFVYRLEDLLQAYIAENNPRLELVRALIKGLEPTLNAWDESIREDLLNA